MEWLKNTPIAHRGLHDADAPENSLLAFQKAMEAGYAIELDVHLSYDGEVVVMHDENLQRMTGVDGEIAQLHLSEIQKHKLLKSDEGVPTLKEVFDLVDGRVPLLIEIKNEGRVGGVESALSALLKTYKGEVAIQSFNPFVLQWFANNAPHIIRGQLSGSFSDVKLAWHKKFLLKNLLLNGISKPHFIAYELDCLGNYMVQKQRKDMPLLGWTVRSDEEMSTVLSRADNIIFELFLPSLEDKKLNKL